MALQVVLSQAMGQSFEVRAGVAEDLGCFKQKLAEMLQGSVLVSHVDLPLHDARSFYVDGLAKAFLEVRSAHGWHTTGTQQENLARRHPGIGSDSAFVLVCVWNEGAMSNVGVCEFACVLLRNQGASATR